MCQGRQPGTYLWFNCKRYILQTGLFRTSYKFTSAESACGFIDQSASIDLSPLIRREDAQINWNMAELLLDEITQMVKIVFKIRLF